MKQEMEKSVWMKQKVSLIKIKHVVNKKVQKGVY